MGASSTLAERFNSKADKAGGPEKCWPWTGALCSGTGYGKVYIGNARFMGAHRAAYTLAHGPIPDGLFVLHRCDNRRCVNPAHLFLGTHADNMADMMAKGRNVRGPTRPEFIRRGDAHHGSKITEAQVAAARTRRAAGEKLRALAAEFGVRPSTLCHRLNGRRGRTYRDNSTSRA